MLRRQQKHYHHHSGFSLIDTIMSLAVISILVVVFANLLYVRIVNRRALLRTQASAIANEELSALKRFDISSLPNQTNGRFLGTLYNAGTWHVVADASVGHSVSNVVELVAGTGFANTVSGRLQFPAGSYGDAKLQVALRFPNDTAAGTAAGIFFRASDARNGYRLLVAPTGTDLDSTVAGQQNWVLEKIIDNVVSTPRLLSKNVAGITTNSWNTIAVSAISTSLQTFLNGTLQDSGLITDADYTDGFAALVGWRGVHAKFDDASTTNGVQTQTWNFDSATTFPAAWVRLGINDLPNSTPTTFDDNGVLTLEAYPNASSTLLKRATITVNWTDGGHALSYTTTALLGSSRIGL